MGFKEAGLRGSLRNVSVGASDIPDSGVSRWGFEQNLTDSWGDNDAVNNGATFTTNSEVGVYALDFDGVDDYVDVGEIGIEGLQEFTLSAWVFSRDPNTTNPQNIMVNGDSSKNDTFDMSVKSGGVRVNVNSFSTNINGGNLTSDTWSMVTFTYDDNLTQSSLYFDGSEVTSGGTSGALNSTPATFKFGGRSGDLFIDGILDDARFYSKALSATEVSNLYDTGSIN